MKKTTVDALVKYRLYILFLLLATLLLPFCTERLEKSWQPLQRLEIKRYQSSLEFDADREEIFIGLK